jgi:hypothetical protein
LFLFLSPSPSIFLFNLLRWLKERSYSKAAKEGGSNMNQSFFDGGKENETSFNAVTKSYLKNITSFLLRWNFSYKITDSWLLVITSKTFPWNMTCKVISNQLYWLKTTCLKVFP